MTEKPFVHLNAFKNVISSFIFQDDFAKFFKKLIHKKGIINIGDKRQSIFNFAKKNNKNVKPIEHISINLDTSVSISKLKKILR